jgi:hypothetical protein
LLADLPPNAIVADAFAYARQNPDSPIARWCTETLIPSVSQSHPAFVPASNVPQIPDYLLTQWATPKNIAIAHIEAWRDAAPATEVTERRTASERMLSRIDANGHIGGDLSLSGCTALTALPVGIVVRGDLYLSHCTALTALPDWLIVLRHTASGAVRNITLAGIPLPNAILEELQIINARNEGVNFILDAPEARRGGHRSLTLRIDRAANIFEQACTFYSDRLIEDFRTTPYVIFNGEMGRDAGGVGKDFNNQTLRSAFNNRSLFAENDAVLDVIPEGNAEQRRFAGRFVAMTHLNNHQPIPAEFSESMLADHDTTALSGSVSVSFGVSGTTN